METTDQTAAPPRKQRRTISEKIDRLKPAAIIINVRFNGLAHFCRLTGYLDSTAHGWLTRGFIPAQRKGSSIHSHILAVAEANEIEMDRDDFVERSAEAALKIVEPEPAIAE